jgi:hypothetical protein
MRKNLKAVILHFYPNIAVQADYYVKRIFASTGEKLFPVQARAEPFKNSS